MAWKLCLESLDFLWWKFIDKPLTCEKYLTNEIYFSPSHDLIEILSLFFHLQYPIQKFALYVLTYTYKWGQALPLFNKLVGFMGVATICNVKYSCKSWKYSFKCTRAKDCCHNVSRNFVKISLAPVFFSSWNFMKKIEVQQLCQIENFGENFLS